MPSWLSSLENAQGVHCLACISPNSPSRYDLIALAAANLVTAPTLGRATPIQHLPWLPQSSSALHSYTDGSKPHAKQSWGSLISLLHLPLIRMRKQSGRLCTAIKFRSLRQSSMFCRRTFLHTPNIQTSATSHSWSLRLFWKSSASVYPATLLHGKDCSMQSRKSSSQI